MTADDAKRLRELERENARLKRIVADARRRQELFNAIWFLSLADAHHVAGAADAAEFLGLPC